MQANLTRVQDLTAELRRQLKPLGRQAEVARRAAVIQADLRDARLRLLADDLVGADRDARGRGRRRDRPARQPRRGRGRPRRGDQAARRDLERGRRAEAPTLARAQETWYRLSSLRERFRGTGSLAAERVRHLATEPEDARSGRDPEELEAQAEQVRAEEAEIEAAVARDRETLQDAVAARQEAEEALGRGAAPDRRGRPRGRRPARGPGPARRPGRRRAQPGRGRQAEIGRLTPALDEAQQRAARAQREFTALEAQVAGLDAGEEDLDAAHEEATAAPGRAEERLTALRAEEREAERERAALRRAQGGARARPGAQGRRRRAARRGRPALRRARLGRPRCSTVEPGYETAVAAALGAAADAVAVVGLGAARPRSGCSRTTTRAGPGCSSAPTAPADAVASRGGLPAGAAPRSTSVTAPEAARRRWPPCSHDVVVVETSAAAAPLVAAHPRWSR